MDRRLLPLAIRGSIVLLLALTVAAVNVMFALQSPAQYIYRILEAAAEKHILSDVVFAFVPLTAAAIFNIAMHMLLRRNWIRQDRIFYGLAILPLTGFLIHALVTTSAEWRELALLAGTTTARHVEVAKVQRIEGLLMINIFLLLLSETLIPLQEEWLKWR
jgi:hypothetical protein